MLRVKGLLLQLPTVMPAESVLQSWRQWQQVQSAQAHVSSCTVPPAVHLPATAEISTTAGTALASAFTHHAVSNGAMQLARGLQAALCLAVQMTQSFRALDVLLHIAYLQLLRDAL